MERVCWIVGSIMRIRWWGKIELGELDHKRVSVKDHEMSSRERRWRTEKKRSLRNGEEGRTFSYIHIFTPGVRAWEWNGKCKYQIKYKKTR